MGIPVSRAVIRSLARGLVRALLAAGLLVPASPAGAVTPGPLPAFDLTTPDGLLVTSDQLGRQGRWLLLYVRPDCLSCDALLDLFGDRAMAQTAPRVVVVVGAGAGEAGRMAAAFPGLTMAAWYADPSGEAFARLALRGAATVLGLREGDVEWVVAGLLPVAGELRSIVADWPVE